jgi:heterodisulfide reductase subunit C
VAACPSARFYDFSPRVFAQVMAREDVDTFYELLNDRVWDCSQCFSCTRCPRQNNPGGIINKEAPLHISNVSLIDPDSGQATRVGYEIKDGKKIRVARRSGKALD